MRHLFTYLLLICSLTATSQIDTVYINKNDGWHTIGADGPSYRTCNGKHCNGLIIDTFPNGQLKEFALYTNGQIRGTFISYYENGQLETISSVDSNGNHIGNLYGYFPNGQLEYLAAFRNKKRIQYRHYTENGKLETYEEVNKDLNLKYHFLFNDNGDTLSAHILIDSVNLIYNCWSKYENGQLEMIGQQKYSPKGWSKIGIWYYYDNKGQLVKIEKK